MLEGGLEPPCREAHEPESCVSANSTTSAKVLWIPGGADRDRTDDLHNAIVALYQLSYNPIKHFPLIVQINRNVNAIPKQSLETIDNSLPIASNQGKSWWL